MNAETAFRLVGELRQQLAEQSRELGELRQLRDALSKIAPEDSGVVIGERDFESMLIRGAEIMRARDEQIEALKAERDEARAALNIAETNTAEARAAYDCAIGERDAARAALAALNGSAP